MYENLFDYTLALQRFDEAREISHEAQTRKLDDYDLHNDLYALAFLRTDSAGMAEQEQWFAGQPEFESQGWHSRPIQRHTLDICARRGNSQTVLWNLRCGRTAKKMARSIWRLLRTEKPFTKTLLKVSRKQ